MNLLNVLRFEVSKRCQDQELNSNLAVLKDDLFKLYLN